MSITNPRPSALAGITFSAEKYLGDNESSPASMKCFVNDSAPVDIFGSAQKTLSLIESIFTNTICITNAISRVDCGQATVTNSEDVQVGSPILSKRLQDIQTVILTSMLRASIVQVSRFYELLAKYDGYVFRSSEHSTSSDCCGPLALSPISKTMFMLARCPRSF